MKRNQVKLILVIHLTSYVQNIFQHIIDLTIVDILHCFVLQNQKHDVFYTLSTFQFGLDTFQELHVASGHYII